MLDFLKRLFRRKKPQPRHHPVPPASTGYAAGRSPATGRPDPLFDPLSPLTPASPLHPFNQMSDCEPVRQHSSSTSACSSNWSGSDSSSYSSSDSSSSSSDSGSGSNCD